MMNLEMKNRVDKSASRAALRRKEKVVELIEVDGKRVSRTSTGKRKFHNKSKNGCDNCKRRRVKCDEGKPMCQKCVNMKLDCVYTPVQPRKRKDLTVVKYITRNADDISDGKATKDDLDEGSTREMSSTNSSNESSRCSSRAGTSDNMGQTDLSANFDGVTNKKAFLNHAKLTGSEALDYKKQQQAHMLSHSNRLNSPGRLLSTTNGSKGVMDGLLLPPLVSDTTNSHQSQQQQLQQQLLLLPQLMTLSNSEKYVAFDLPNSPSLQPTGMNITNSIGSIFSPSRFPTTQLQQQQQPQQQPQNQNQHQQQNHQQQQQEQHQQEISQQQQGGQNHSQLPQQTNLPTNPLSFHAESIAQLNKASLNLKAMGMFPTAGIGGVTYDFQELLGIKYNGSSQAAKASSAEEALANMQEQQEQATKSDNSGNESDEGDGPAHMIETPNLPNNPTISPVAPITPMTKSSMNGSRTSPSAAAVASRDNIDDSITKGESMTKSQTQESSSSADTPQSGHIARLLQLSSQGNLNLIDLKLFHHYCTKVWPSITAAGISGLEVWSTDIPDLAFEYPFLMHSLLAFSATHLSRTESGLEQYVSSHRLNALRLLREAVLQISEDNTDALVASALILIMDSLANASTSSPANPNSMSPSAWIFHVKGAATILTAVWPLTEKSRFYNLISVDLSDLGDVVNQESGTISELVCFDESIADLYPVEIDSPYLITLAYLDKLNREKNQSDFILRVFAFPALLDKTFLALLMTGDLGAMRIMRSYYKLLRGFTTEMKDKVWFLEGVSQVLPQDVDEYSGGGGMHMMLDFLGGGLPSMTTTNLSEFM